MQAAENATVSLNQICQVNIDGLDPQQQYVIITYNLCVTTTFLWQRLYPNATCCSFDEAGSKRLGILILKKFDCAPSQDPLLPLKVKILQALYQTCKFHSSLYCQIVR